MYLLFSYIIVKDKKNSVSSILDMTFMCSVPFPELIYSKESAFLISLESI